MTQSFDEWFELHQKEVFKNGQGCFDGGYKLGAKIAYKAGAASRQAEIELLEKEIIETQEFLNNQNCIKQAVIDELQKRIEKVLIEVNLYYDTDGMHELFFFDIANILKGNQND